MSVILSIDYFGRLYIYSNYSAPECYILEPVFLEINFIIVCHVLKPLSFCPMIKLA